MLLSRLIFVIRLRMFWPRRFRFRVRLGLYLASALLSAASPISSLAQQAATPPSSPSTVPAAPQPAQPQAVHLKDYSVPRAAFPRVLQPYTPQEVAQPNLGNSTRIDSLMRNGKIYLSIDDAVALALENNLDLDIARYNLNIADADLLRAKSGASILGVNTGIVQNTPGGGVGGLGGTVGSGTGGTTVAAGGAGTGTNGLVSSTLGIGAPITSFDPALTATLQLDKNDTESVSVFSPVPVVAQNTYTSNFGYIQGFEWGGVLSGAFNNSHLTTNNPTELASRPNWAPVSNSASRKTCCRVSGSSRTRALFEFPKTIAKFPMWLSACRSLPPSTRSKTCIGIWCSPTRMFACSRNL